MSRFVGTAPPAVPCSVDPGTAIVRTFVDAGRTHFTGVPCSSLRRTFRVLEDPEPAGLAGKVRYLPATREDNALGVASGLALTGHDPVVLMQNSGLGYSLNALMSFTLIYELHLPLVIGWRGHDETDAVEHDVIGRRLTDLLDVFGVAWTVLDPTDPPASVRRCLTGLEGGRRTSALLVRGGA